MAKIKGIGAPTRKTKGGIGDIYTDRATGKEYKCEGSYGSAAHDTEYYWRAVKDNITNAKNIQKTEKPVEVKLVETPAVEEVTEVAEEVVENVDAESAPEVEETKPSKKGGKRTNYAAAYNNK